MSDELKKNRWYQKSATNGWLAAMMVVVPLLTSIINNIAPIINAIKGPEKPQLPQIANTQVRGETTKSPPDTPQEDSKCYGLFPNTEFDIETRKDRVEVKSDTISPTGSGKTWEGIYWFNKVIKPNFSTINIEYAIIPENKNDKPPSLIFTIGRTLEKNIYQTISQIWIPEYSEREDGQYLQLARFSRVENFETGELVKQAPVQLPDSVTIKQTDSLSIKSMEANGSKISAQITYKYLWKKAGQANPFNFNEEILFPFSDLKNSNEDLNLGIGTYVGNKLKVVKLEVCY